MNVNLTMSLVQHAVNQAAKRRPLSDKEVKEFFQAMMGDANPGPTTLTPPNQTWDPKGLDRG